MRNIRNLRKKAGFTQVQLAEKLSVTQAAVSQWEQGLRYPNIALAIKLAALLGCTIDELLTEPK